MTQALAAPNSVEWTSDQMRALRDTVAHGLSDGQFRFFALVCQRTGLDPFRKQIYAILRKVKNYETGQYEERLTIQTGIDGYRAIAVRSGRYDGQDPPQWCGKDGVWVDVWTKDEPPFAAKQTVYRAGARAGFTSVARWGAYVQTTRDGKPTGMWGRMGPEQLAKCAEALSLRKGFPEDLSGVHTHEEMGQADNPRTLAVVDEETGEIFETPPKQLAAPEEPEAEDPPAEHHVLLAYSVALQTAKTYQEALQLHNKAKRDVDLAGSRKKVLASIKARGVFLKNNPANDPERLGDAQT